MRKYLIIIGLFLTVTLSGQLPGVINSQGGGSAPAAVYTDDFESYGTYSFGTEETLTGKGSWIAGAAGKAQILGNDGAGDDYISGDLVSGYGTLIYNDTFANNQYAQIVLDALAGTTDKIGIGVRLSGSGATLDGYICIAHGTYAILYRLDDGVATQLAYYQNTITADVILKLSISGTTLTAYLNNVAITWTDTGLNTLTDATYATGKAGVSAYGWSNGCIGDDWEGGDL